MIPCKDRVDAYMRNMRHSHGLEMRVRYLDKIYQAGIDKDYMEQEHTDVVNGLVKELEREENPAYRALYSAYAFAICRQNGGPFRHTPFRLPDLLDVDGSRDEPPPVVTEYVKRLMEALAKDQEIERIFNIKISKNHFAPGFF